MDDRKTRTSESGSDGPVPAAVVSRLSLYLRELQAVQAAGGETINSTQLGARLGFTDAQVRKDLAYFGQFGCPGVGYRCDELVTAVRGILGTDRHWPIAVIGMGNLGRALLRYRGFSAQGFEIVAAFDVAPEKLGYDVEGVRVHHLDELPEVARNLGIRLAMIAVPAPAAQMVASAVVHAGIEGVLNFAPVTLSLPDTVRVVGVDLAIQLEQLSFAVVNRQRNP